MNPIEPGAVLPSQMIQLPPWSGEKRLALAVLENSVGMLLRAIRTESLQARIIANEQLAWIRSDNLEGPFAFEIICIALQIDADWLRGGIEKAVLEKKRCGQWRLRRGEVQLKKVQPVRSVVPVVRRREIAALGVAARGKLTGLR